MNIIALVVALSFPTAVMPEVVITLPRPVQVAPSAVPAPAPSRGTCSAPRPLAQGGGTVRVCEAGAL